ncbi:uncharacterized protein LOC130456547 [Monodelphis domestica]|uniref:uncharacterized protein LOC130456547 n=1 Tax=Monodelphis domestica TaxID=13616 RepID=UPI0024E21FEA|nr:uncharacterized protein LOC130456547 [Monodelphis domestica]
MPINKPRSKAREAPEKARSEEADGPGWAAAVAAAAAAPPRLRGSRAQLSAPPHPKHNTWSRPPPTFGAPKFVTANRGRNRGPPAGAMGPSPPAPRSRRRPELHRFPRIGKSRCCLCTTRGPKSRLSLPTAYLSPRPRWIPRSPCRRSGRRPFPTGAAGFAEELRPGNGRGRRREAVFGTFRKELGRNWSLQHLVGMSELGSMGETARIAKCPNG